MRDLTPLPIDESGNGSSIETLKFDRADAPMLMQALGIAVTTAMMCSGKESVRRLQYYKEQFKKLSPPAVKLLNEETDLCEIAITAVKAETWTIYRVKEFEYKREFRTIIEIGHRRFSSARLVNEEQHLSIKKMVQDVVPYSCEEHDHEDVIVYPWNIRSLPWIQ